MKIRNIFRNIFLVSFITAILLLVGCQQSYDQKELETFAKCLTEEGAKMFGAYWCPHCKDQKKAFGKSWQYVDYIECSLPGGNGQTQVCAEAGITGYPTWEFSDGSRRSGAVSFEALSSVTGCQLPE